MLHVILLILKILGIILLVILGLLLLILYAVLFVSVSYRIQAERADRFRATACAAWLFRIFTIRFSFVEGSGDGPILKLRVFGYPVWRILGDEAPKRSWRRLWRRRRRGRGDGQEHPAETDDAGDPSILEKDIEPHERTDPPDWEPDGSGRDQAGDGSSAPGGRDEPLSGSDQAEPEPDPSDPGKTGDAASAPDECIQKPSHRAKSGEKKRRTPFFIRIIEEIRTSVRRLFGKFRQFRKKLTGVGETFRKLQGRKDGLLEFWNLEEHVRARASLFREAQYLWKKSRPKKIRGKITFGFADPAHTGLCMGAVGMLCAWYPAQLEIVPDFEQEILRGDVQIRGRIRCYVFVRILLRIYFDKDIRQMYRHLSELRS